MAPPLAGAMGVSLPRFIVFSAAGALLWAIVPVVAGMVFSAQVEQALAWVQRMGTRGVMVAAALIIVYAGVKFLQRHLLIRRLRSVRVDAPALRDLMQAGAALVVLDARSPTARRLDPRHIPGAIAINIGEAEKELRPNMHDHDIVVYCS